MKLKLNIPIEEVELALLHYLEYEKGIDIATENRAVITTLHKAQAEITVVDTGFEVTEHHPCCKAPIGEEHYSHCHTRLDSERYD